MFHEKSIILAIIGSELYRHSSHVCNLDIRIII